MLVGFFEAGGKTEDRMKTWPMATHHSLITFIVGGIVEVVDY